MPDSLKNSFDFDKESFLHPISGERKISIKPSYFTSYVKYSRAPKEYIEPIMIAKNGTEWRVTCVNCGKLLSDDETYSRIDTCASCRNLKENKHTGELSDKSKARLHLAFDWMYHLSQTKTAFNDKLKRWYPFKLALLSIKLPCTQIMHEYDPRPESEHFRVNKKTGESKGSANPLSPSEQSDLYIKHYMLNEFLTILRTKYDLHFYIWRAEKEENVILHFHILHDRYIPYGPANKIWNKILKKHGYIDKYRNNQLAFHKDGFRFRPEYAKPFNEKTGKPQKVWSYAKQLAAFKKGMAQNWQQPTGTSDIHSIRRVNNTKAYIAKYICKPSDISTKTSEVIEIYKKNNEIEILDPEVESVIKKTVLQEFAIAGNLWYISQPLSRLKSAITDASEIFVELFKKIQKEAPKRIYISDWCQIFKFNIRDIINKNYTPLLEPLKAFIKDIREKYYKTSENIFSTLGIPLTLFDFAPISVK